MSDGRRDWLDQAGSRQPPAASRTVRSGSIGQRARFGPRLTALGFIIASLVVFAVPAQAQEDPATPADVAETTPDPPFVRARFNIDWLNAARLSSLAEGALNPGNVRLQLPQSVMQTELRGNVRVEFGSRAQLIVRPRVRGAISWSSVDDQPTRDERDTEANWTELYGTWIPNEVLSVTWGLQNFQWGPAELLAPNNRVFHETGLFRDPLYYVRGKHLLRVNLSAGKQWSAVALAELGATDETPFRAGEAFARQALGKIEYTTANGASYVGVTVGATDGTPPWFGAYGSYAVTEGLSLYADTSHTRGSQAWYPVTVSGVGGASLGTFARPLANDGSWTTLAVFGGRYTFARGDDLRVEYLLNDAGWTRDQLQLGFDTVSATTSPSAYAPYLASGLEYVGRHFVFVSLRNPELPPLKRTQLQTRYLHSLTDTSRVLFVTASYNAADALVLFSSVTMTGGPPEGEFSRLARGSFVLGAVYTW